MKEIFQSWEFKTRCGRGPSNERAAVKAMVFGLLCLGKSIQIRTEIFLLGDLYKKLKFGSHFVKYCFPVRICWTTIVMKPVIGLQNQADRGLE